VFAASTSGWLVHSGATIGVTNNGRQPGTQLPGLCWGARPVCWNCPSGILSTQEFAGLNKCIALSAARI